MMGLGRGPRALTNSSSARSSSLSMCWISCKLASTSAETPASLAMACCSCGTHCGLTLSPATQSTISCGIEARLSVSGMSSSWSEDRYMTRLSLAPSISPPTVLRILASSSLYIEEAAWVSRVTIRLKRSPPLTSRSCSSKGIPLTRLAPLMLGKLSTSGTFS